MENPICPPSGQDFRLIETFGYHPSQGIARAPLHVQRLQNSAKVLEFDFDRHAVSQRMDSIVSEVPLRCRLTLGRAGDLELTTAPMPAKMELMRFEISEQQIQSDNALLRHKTTRREIYDGARLRLAEGIDETVFLNERGEVCEGSITNIVITAKAGNRLTPPLSSGCLPGVYRQSQIEQGLWREEVLTLADLRNAQSINLTNSLRGSISAVLVA